MKSLSLLLTLMALCFHRTNTACAEGCLACAKDDSGNAKCQICDLYNSYRLSSNGSCFKWNVENCEIPTSDPEDLACNLCQPGFFLENLGKRCSPVPDKFKIPDCKRYHWEYSCNECNSGFYLVKNTCRPISGEIENCSIYADAKTCAKCKEGYFYHVGSKKCEALTKRNQCLVYSSVECTECASGYFEVENVSSGASLSSNFLQSLAIYNIVGSENSSFYENKPVNQCVQGTLEHCAKHSSFDSCAQCSSGYFLSPSKTCVSDPIRTVAHCEAYKGANNCSRCTKGFYLEDNVCRSLNDVNGCLEFDPVTEDCLKCDYVKYYLESGFCGLRDKSMNIEYCKEKSNVSDHCVTCIPSFQLTDDKLKCLPHIPHCATYVSDTDVTDGDFTNVDTLELKCDTCDDHFYPSPNNRECIPQNSSGCVSFTTNTNDCETCASGYFKTADNTCSLYTKNLCKTFEPDSDACASCFDGFFLSAPDCVKYTARNCLTFETAADNCDTCPKQYYKETDGATSQSNCFPLTVRNCKTYATSGVNGPALNECTECYQGYKKVDNQCVSVALVNCAKQVPDQDSCDTCKVGYYKDTNNHCLPYTVKNCDPYNATADRCSLCAGFETTNHKNNKYYLTSEGNCLPYTVLNCKTKVSNENKCQTCESKDWYINSHGDCALTALKHCETIVPGSLSNECATCMDGFKLVSGKCYRLNLPGCTTYTDETCTACASGFYLSGDKCHVQTGDNCATFLTTAVGCATCIPGFVLNGAECLAPSVANCKEYDAAGACTVCHNGYHLDSPNCSPQSITNCIVYVPNIHQCAECRVGFTVSANSPNNTCQLVTKFPRCMQPKPTDNTKCSICFRGYKLNTSSELCEAAPSITNCIKYQSNTGLCEVCSHGMVPTVAKTGCEAITLTTTSNCGRYDLNDGSCMSCENGYYLTGEGGCVQQDKSNCLTHKPNENYCLECKEDYNMEDGECFKVFSDSQCLHYNSDHSECVICRSGSYLDDGKCYYNNLSNCAVKAKNKNECMVCRDGWTLGPDKDCGGDIGNVSENCFKLNKSTGKCEYCSRGFQLNADGTCSQQTTPTATDFELDPSCLSTNAATRGECAYCPQGNSSIKFEWFALDMTTDYLGCYKVDASGNCTQCKAGYDTLAGNKACSPASGSSLCKQMKPNHTAGVTIDTATECGECKDYNLQDLAGGTCTAKKTVNLQDNFGQPASGNKYCGWGSVWTTAFNRDTIECGVINDSAFALIDGCEAYDFTTMKCKRCKTNYNRSGDNSTCTTNANYFNPVLSLTTSGNVYNVGDLTSTDMSSLNSTLDIEITNTGDGSSSYTPYVCDSGMKKVIDLTSTPKPLNFATGEDNDLISIDPRKVSFAASEPRFTCVPDASITTFYGDGSGAAAISESANEANCLYWATDGTAYNCMGCIDGLLPVYKKAVNHYTSGSGASPAAPPSNELFKSYLDSCKTTADISSAYPDFDFHKTNRLYKGLEYNKTWDKPRVSRWVNVDTCSNGSLVLFALEDSHTLIPHTYLDNISQDPVNTKTIYNFACFKKSEAGASYFITGSATLDTPGGVENCQIHYWGNNTETALDGTIASHIPGATALDGSLLKCLSCKPGHRSSLADTNKYFDDVSLGDCKPITNCSTDLTKNTWMNACETCEDTYGWKIDSGTGVVQFDRCVRPNTGETADCLLYSGTDGTNYTCVLCRKGFFLNGGNCVARTEFAGCSLIGRAPYALPESSLDDNGLIFQFLVLGYFEARQDYCDSCVSGTYPIHWSASNEAVCTKDFQFQITNNSSTRDTKCMYFDTNYSTCQLCRDDQGVNRYIKDHTGACVAKTTGPASRFGCIEMDSSSKCITCRNGYLDFTDSNSDKVCYTKDEMENEWNCSVLTGDKCTVCRENSVHDSNNKHKCLTYTTGKCKRLNSNGSCYSCAEDGHYPLNFKLNTPSGDITHKYECIYQHASNISKYSHMSIVYDFGDNTLKDSGFTLPPDILYQQVTDLATYTSVTGDNYRDKCINVITTSKDNCIEASVNSLKCSKCAPGYTKTTAANDFNTCAEDPDPLKRCLRFYPDSLECEICKGDYKLDLDTKQCILRSFTAGEYTYDPTCKGNNSTDLECDHCPQGNKSMPVGYYQRAYASAATVLDCLELNSAADLCVNCGVGKEVDGSTATACTDGTAADPLNSSAQGDLCNMLTTPIGAAATALEDGSCKFCIYGALLNSNACATTNWKLNSYVDTISSTQAYVQQPFATSRTDNHNYASHECSMIPLSSYFSSVEISDCKVYNTDLTCAMCDHNYTVSAPTTCTAVADEADYYYVFDSDLAFDKENSTGVALNSSTADNVLAYQRELGTFETVQCGAALFPVEGSWTSVAHRTPIGPIVPNDTAVKTKIEFYRSYPILSCSTYTAGTTSLLTNHTALSDITKFPIGLTLLSDHGSTITPTVAHCALWQDTSNGHKCIRCHDGYFPYILASTATLTSSSGTVTVTNFTSSEDYTTSRKYWGFIQKCVLATGTIGSTAMTGEKIYQGLSYYKTDIYPLGGYVSVDNCTDANQIPVLFGTWHGGGLSLFSHNTYTTTIPDLVDTANEGAVLGQACIDFTSADYMENVIAAGTDVKYTINVANCQVYGYFIEGSFTPGNAPASYAPPALPKFNNTNMNDFKCISCRPGYRPTGYSGKNITSCVQIANCDQTAANNKWMNACQTCKPGYAWAYDGPTKEIYFDQCIELNNKPNCKIVNNTNLHQCILCKAGYVIHSDQTCVPESYLTAKNCDLSEKPFPYHRLTMASSPTAVQYKSLDFLNYFGQTHSMKASIDCAKCQTGYTLMRIKTDHGAYFSNHYRDTKWHSTPNIANCNNYDPDHQERCVRCKSGYVLVTATPTATYGSECVEIPASVTAEDDLIANCLSIIDTTDYKCNQCDTQISYTKVVNDGTNDYHLCYKYEDPTTFNCEKFDWQNEECLVCNENHIFSTKNSPIACIPVTIADMPDTFCTMPGKNGRCLKCKGTNYHPFHWKPAAQVNGNDYFYKCIDQGRPMDDLIFEIVRGYDLSTKQYFTMTDLVLYETHFTSTPPTDWSTYTGATYTAYTNNDDYDHLCFNIMDDQNFSNCSWLGNDLAKCSECASNMKLTLAATDFNTCTEFQCGNYNVFSEKCLKCREGTNFLGAGMDTCTGTYTASITANCNKLSIYEDRCLVCNSGYYLDQSNGTCTAVTPVTNCASYDSVNDKCLSCVQGYIYEDAKCKIQTLDNCLLPSYSTWGECLACSPGFDLVRGSCYVVSPVSLLCKERGDDGKCSSCFDGYTLTMGSCTETYKTQPIKGCLTYDAEDMYCEVCEDHLDLSNGHCIDESISNCNSLSEDKTHCLACDEMFYHDGIVCSPRLKLNCLEYSKNSDQCLTCLPDSRLDQGSCVGYTADYCKTFHPTRNECMTCVDNYFFDVASRKCVQYSINNCQLRDFFRNRCNVCISGYYLGNEGLCVARTVEDCLETDPHADSCITCKEGYYLVTDNGDTVVSTSNLLNSCKPYTIEDCVSKDPHSDTCIDCAEGFFLSSGTCLARTAFNCETWNSSQTACLSCPKNSYLSNGICNFYSVTDCSTYSQNSDECLSCPQYFYKQGTTCLPYSISNCDIFVEGHNKCSQCEPGFFLRNGTCQVISQNNCATTSLTENACSSCVKGYYLQNGVCLSYTISCSEYSPDNNECISCPKGQYLEEENKTCINYTVSNCATFSLSSNHCETCVDNHYFSGGLCIQYTVVNCRVYHSLFDECITCQDNFYHHKQTCLPYNVNNCQKYSPVSDICLTCLPGHFNMRGNCIKYTAENCGTFHPERDSCVTCASKMFYRLHIVDDLYKCTPVTEVDDCDIYEDFLDKCHTCETGYYLDQSTNSCHEVPETVANCKEFSNADQCKTCIAPYFLKDNECVKSDHIIDKCIKYETNTKCGECDGANMLSDDATLCLKITEPSCATYLDPSNCKTCEGNHVINYIDDVDGSIVSGLNGEDLSTRRAFCNTSGISNCAHAKESFPNNTCLECMTGYFLASSSSCNMVTLTVDHCETYFADGICAQCENNHVLSTDKKECSYDVSFLGANCQSGKFFSEPKCFLCQPGHYFDSEGNCQACAMQGCAVCTEDASASCKLCMDGYYMNEDMQCNKNGTATNRMSKEWADDGLIDSFFVSESIRNLSTLAGFFLLVILDKFF